MKSSDEFTGHVPAASEVPDFDSDPFRLIANAEEDLVDHYHFNLQGKPIMSNTLKNALNEAGVTHTRHTFFDLIEFIEEKLDHEQVLANVTNSMAWFVDTMAINNARAMFFRDYRDSDGDGTRDAYSAFIDGFLANVEMAGESEFGDGASKDLVDLLGFSPTMHDLAGRMSDRIGREYNPRSFDELLANEKPRDIDALSLAKLAQLAKFVDDGDGDEETVLKGLVEREKLTAAERHANNLRINPVVSGLIDIAKRHSTDGIEFHQLDRKLQERMIQQTSGAIKQAMSRLATYKSIDTLTFAMILKNCKAVMAELDQVLATYRTPEEDATIKAQQRALKTKAKSSEAGDFEQAEADEAKAKQDKIDAAKLTQIETTTTTS